MVSVSGVVAHSPGVGQVRQLMVQEWSGGGGIGSGGSWPE